MAALARSLGINADQVRQWRHGQDDRKPSPRSCALIERATAGDVTCEELRPDLVWQRTADREWPNAKGRPLLDISAVAA